MTCQSDVRLKPGNWGHQWRQCLFRDDLDSCAPDATRSLECATTTKKIREILHTTKNLIRAIVRILCSHGDWRPEVERRRGCRDVCWRSWGCIFRMELWCRRTWPGEREPRTQRRGNLGTQNITWFPATSCNGEGGKGQKTWLTHFSQVVDILYFNVQQSTCLVRSQSNDEAYTQCTVAVTELFDTI